MLLKFFNRGTGKGKTPVEYLLKETDANGLKRDPLPQLIKGNPQQIINLIDSLDFKHKYRSGVISFAPSDAPTPQQQQALIQSFEEVAFAGLEPDQYDILWVRHTHTGSSRVELHFVTPRVELTTGKSLNIAPPGWENYFRPWRDYWNITHNWASPDDPQRARTHHPGYQALINAQNHRLELNGQKPLPRNDARQIITNFLTEYISDGRIKNRHDIINTLEDAGFTITRKGEDYITVTHNDLDQRIRLKGGLYRESWRPGENLTTEARTGQTTSREDFTRERGELSAKLAENLQKRREYHQSRYRPNYPSSPNLVVVDGLSTSSDDSYSLSGYLRRQLGDESILNPTLSRNPNSRTEFEPSAKEKLGSGTLSKPSGKIYHSTPQHQHQNQLEMSRKALLKTLEKEDERTRKRTATDLQKLCDSIRSGQERAERTNDQLSEANRIAQQCHQDLNEQSQRTGKRLSRNPDRLRRIKMNRTDELEQFKTQINLVQYVQSQG
jgi:hypothetical protein